MKSVITLLVICLIYTASIFAQTKPGDKTPSVSLKDLTGKAINLSDFRGKVVLLNFWATWCVPCKAEIPDLVKWQNNYQNRGLQVIGIAYPPTNPSKVRNFVRRLKINYPILFGSTKTKTLFDSGKTLPFTVVIDKEGNVKDLIEGVIFPEEFDVKVKPLLKPLGLTQLNIYLIKIKNESTKSQRRRLH